MNIDYFEDTKMLYYLVITKNVGCIPTQQHAHLFKKDITHIWDKWFLTNQTSVGNKTTNKYSDIE